MLGLISDEKCLYLAEQLDKLYSKPVATIKEMTNFQNRVRKSCIKTPLVADYSKIKVYTWYLRSLLFLALKDEDHLQLQHLQHIVELSNKLFPLSVSFDNISDIEELLFAWLNIIITPSLREDLPNCFHRQSHEEFERYDKKKPIWLTYNLCYPIVFVFNMIDVYYDGENNDENVDDEDERNSNDENVDDEDERNSNDENVDDEDERNSNDEDDDNETDNVIIIPFLKLNGVPTNTNDYNFIPIEKTRLQQILQFFMTMLCTPLLDLPSCYDIQYLIDRLSAVGFKNDLISDVFYEVALKKFNVIFELKSALYALKINDPILVNINIERKILIEERHDKCCQQMKSLFDGALQLSSTDRWKIQVHMGYTYYFLLGYYSEAIDLLKTVINDYNTNQQKDDRYALSIINFGEDSKKCPVLSYVCEKLNQPILLIPAIVLAYYTLFQCFRMTEQWDNGLEYIGQFKQICTKLEITFKEKYDHSVIKLLLATSLFCVASVDEVEIRTELANELMSLCGIQCLICRSDRQNFLDHEFTLELPYALSECGGENEQIHTKPRPVEKIPNMLIIRHGYDCYKMRSWLICETTILNELEKWISRLPVIVVLED
ncbi:unnamed protein product [Didymodactylos carnosus]|uniref:Uncharacterized protein n=1 Tax=Didymodactylos carnosus TaxID=1234261 RepID=A0A8S2CM64_9BILA|nr:unnamed protein product [Didymodactylos carnosus]CAF3498873.1 unnamed protein product [Didymodactylos carnosus]